METIFKTDKNGNQRYTSIRVQKLKDGTANIIKATGVVDGKESISTTHVPLGYESALKRAKTIWKNLQVPDVMPMLANKWDDRKRYISEPFYAQPKPSLQNSTCITDWRGYTGDHQGRCGRLKNSALLRFQII